MKVIWDDLGRSIKLIVCAMGNYYLASIWIKEKAQIQSYSLKESIIVLIGMMFFIVFLVSSPADRLFFRTALPILRRIEH